jgi:hypothetical protein
MSPDMEKEAVAYVPVFSRSPIAIGNRAGSRGHHSLPAIMTGRWAVWRIHQRIVQKRRPTTEFHRQPHAD